MGGTEQPLKQYAKKRFVRLIVPYFTFEALNWIIWWVKCLIAGTNFPYLSSMMSIITCINNDYMGLYGRLWLLPCMFIADIYVWFILHYFRKNRLGLLVSILVLFVLSFFTSSIITWYVERLPFTLDTGLFAAAFLLIGYILGDLIKELTENGKQVLKVILALISLTYLAYGVARQSASVLMYINRYGEYTVSVCTAVSGIIAFFIIGSHMYRWIMNCQWMEIMKRFILWYGMNSLMTFPVHLGIKIFLLDHLPLLSSWIPTFMIMLFLNIPIVNLITNCFPFMLGKIKV